MKLNFLSGNHPLEGHVNLDGQRLPGTTKVAWIDPWYPKLPFRADTFEEIYANNAVEHIANPNALIQEFWRISKNGARWYILTPGYRDPNSWNDPTHLSHWADKMLDFYTEWGFDGRRYGPALISYRFEGDNDHGLTFHVIARKTGIP